MEPCFCDREIKLSNLKCISHQNCTTPFSLVERKSSSSKVSNNFLSTSTRDYLCSKTIEICDSKVICDNNNDQESCQSSSRNQHSSSFLDTCNSKLHHPSKVFPKLRKVPLINIFLLGSLLLLRYVSFYLA